MGACETKEEKKPAGVNGETNFGKSATFLKHVEGGVNSQILETFKSK
jgi:hypothetical protein